jgi:hypothetical protein
METPALVSKATDALKSTKDEIHRKAPFDMLEKKTVKKIHLKIWNKRSKSKDLLAEVVSTIDLGSFAIGKDTFWLPAIQLTQAKLLNGITWDSKGMSIDNMLNFDTRVLDDKSLETTVRFEHNFSAQKNYRVQTHLNGNSWAVGDIRLWIFGFKITSKGNRYEIIEDENFQEHIKENKYTYSGKDVERFGLKNLGLDMFEVGTIEIEVVN